MKNFRGKVKLLIGIIVSILFMYLAFRKVNFYEMGNAFQDANYWYIILALGLLFFSHWLRAIRWHYLMVPIEKVKITPLFSALMIGYMANVFLPAHLGEFLRAYVLGKRSNVPASAVFGTVVIERIIDIFVLILFMGLTFVVFPFPDWVKNSGYITFVFAVFLLLALVLMKRYREASLRLLSMLLKPFPEKISSKIDELMHSFLDGVVGLKNWRHYAIMVVLSLLMWICYGMILQLCFYAFSFVSVYNFPWTAALVVLVITTISILVPSSPGYIGTYHYLCQLSLGMFAVPESEALSFAFVAHGLSYFPILIVGLFFAGMENISIKKMSGQSITDIKPTSVRSDD